MSIYICIIPTYITWICLQILEGSSLYAVKNSIQMNSISLYLCMWGFSIIRISYSSTHSVRTQHTFPHKLFNKNGKSKMYCGSSLYVFHRTTIFCLELWIFVYCIYVPTVCKGTYRYTYIRKEIVKKM